MRLTYFSGVWVVVLTACAPSIDGLIAERHWTEALAGIEEKKDEAARAKLRRAIDHDLDPSLHLTVVTKEHLARAVGPELAAALDDTIMVRVHYSQNDLVAYGANENDALVTPWLAQLALDEGDRHVPLANLDLPGLCARTKEKLPERRTETASTGSWGDSIYRLFYDGAELATLGHAGILFLRPPPYESPPLPSAAPSGPPLSANLLGPSERADVVRAAPHAYALWYALHPFSMIDLKEPNRHVDQLLAWQRPKDPHAPLRVRLSLDVKRMFSLEYEVTLPDAPSLEERFAGAFGDREKRLAEIGRLRE